MSTPALNLQRIAELTDSVSSFTSSIALSSQRMTAQLDDLIANLTSSLDRLNDNIVEYGELNDSRQLGTQDMMAKQDASKAKNDQKSTGSKKILNLNFNEFLSSLRGGILTAFVNASSQAFRVVQKAWSSAKEFGLDKKLGSAIKSIGTKSSVLVSSLSKSAPALAGAASFLIRGVMAVGSALGPLAPIAIGAGIAFGALVTAVASLPSIFMSIVEFAGKFVGALDPAVMAKLSLTMSDLMAVIGVGLRPIIVAAIAVLRTFADMLLPVMRLMEPAIRQFASALIKIAVPFMTIWANAIAYLIPIIDSFSMIIETVAESMRVMIPILTFLFRAISFGVNIFISSFFLVQGVVLQLISAFGKATAWIISWIPGLGKASKKIMEASNKAGEMSEKSYDRAGRALFNAMRDPLKEMEKVREGGSIGMAAKQATYSGISDLGKNMMQAAFGSSTENIAKEQLNAQQQAVNELRDIKGAIGFENKNNKPMAGARK